MRKHSRWLIVGFVLIFVTACGGGATAPEAVTEQTEVVAAPAAASETELASQLSVYNWADYIDESLLTKYKETYGVEIVYDTFASSKWTTTRGGGFRMLHLEGALVLI